MSGFGLSAGTWTSRAVADGVHCVLAPNAGPMTLDGTNTWVLWGAGPEAVVIDPGPDDEGHHHRVLAVCEQAGRRVGRVWLTHGHLDHSEGARPFAQRAGGVPVRALDHRLCLGAEGLVDGTVLDLADRELRVVSTPGHTSDSLSFVLAQDARTDLLSGDTILGRGTAVVAHPDGLLGPYLDSLRRLRAIVEDLPAPAGGVAVLPGHGPVLTDAARAIEGYLSHREQRLHQVRAALARGAVNADDVVADVYADVPTPLWPAARLSVLAQLRFLGVSERGAADAPDRAT